ncbi:hypothetical protein U5801_29505, partial [Lamprobacter modestohalophilus]|uniref:hypothetical protein n=1 Tax=Lamprobacter modestohalophilus TaxID=1064514 RepID=UPI002ADEFB1D
PRQAGSSCDRCSLPKNRTRQQPIERRIFDSQAGVLGHEGRLAAVVVPEAEAARDQDQDRLRQQISDEIPAASRGLASSQLRIRGAGSPDA